MKKTLLTSTLILISHASFAEQNPMIEMTIAMMKQNGQFDKMASCTGKPPAKLESGMREVLSLCMQEANLNDDEAMDSCMQKNVQAKLGITKAQIEACKSPEEQQEGAFHDKMAKLQEQLDKIAQEEERINTKASLTAKDEARLDALGQQYAELESQLFDLEESMQALSMSDNEKAMQELLNKGDALSKQDQAKLKALQEAIVQESMAEMNEQMAMVAKASEGTLDSITLPVYSNSKVMVHIPQGMSIGGDGIKALPAATFSSTDSVEQIARYYQKKLPKFKMKKMDDGQVVLMEKMPADFDLLKHFNEYASTPHVTITPAPNQGMGMPKGTKSTIEIAYRAK